VLAFPLIRAPSPGEILCLKGVEIRPPTLHISLKPLFFPPMAYFPTFPYNRLTILSTRMLAMETPWAG
jgi:hypothetical protein